MTGAAFTLFLDWLPSLFFTIIYLYSSSMFLYAAESVQTIRQGLFIHTRNSFYIDTPAVFVQSQRKQWAKMKRVTPFCFECLCNTFLSSCATLKGFVCVYFPGFCCRMFVVCCCFYYSLFFICLLLMVVCVCVCVCVSLAVCVCVCLSGWLAVCLSGWLSGCLYVFIFIFVVYFGFV